MTGADRLRGAARGAVDRAARQPWAAATARAALRASGTVDRRAPGVLTILTYHRVAPAEGSPALAPTMRNASPEEFDAQLALLRDVATPVSLAQVRSAIEHDEELPARPVLVTFDDAYRDFAEHAWPVLRRHGVPAAMFVATAYPGDPQRAFWWDRLWAALCGGARPRPSEALIPDGVPDEPMALFQALRTHLKALPHEEAMTLVDELASRSTGPGPAAAVLAWDELRALHDDGLAVGAHSHTHPLLTRLPTVQAEEEIRRSIEELRSRGFVDAPVFAYPAGAHDAAVRDAARAAGSTMAMTTDRGANRLDRLDRFSLRRVNVGTRTSPAVLAAELLPSLGRSRRWAP